MKALIILLGVIALLVLVIALGASVWACVFMLAAWLVSYPLTWAYAYAAGLILTLVLSALRKAA